jgi:hypothetical protein
MIDDKNSSSDGIHSVASISTIGDDAAHVVQERSYKKREIYTYNNGIYTLLKVHPPLNYIIEDDDEEEEKEEKEKEDYRDQEYDIMKEFAATEVEEDEDEDDSIIEDIIINPLPRGDKSCLLPTIIEEETILPTNSSFKRSSSNGYNNIDDSRDDDDDSRENNDHDCNDDVLATIIHTLLNWDNNLNENPTTTTSTSILFDDSSKDVTPPPSSSSAVAVPSMVILSSSNTDNEVNSFPGKLVPTEHYKSSNDDNDDNVVDVDNECSNKSNINTDKTIQPLSSQPLKKKKKEEEEKTTPPLTVRDLLPRRPFGLYPPSMISFQKSYLSTIKTKMMGATTNYIACPSGCTGDDTRTTSSTMKSFLCCNSNNTAEVDIVDVNVDIEKLSDSSTSMVSLTHFPSSSKTTSSQDTNATSSCCSDDNDDDDDDDDDGSDSISSYLSIAAKSRRQQQQENQSILDDITTSSTVVDHTYYSFGSPFLASTIRLVEDYEEAFASICFFSSV